MDEHELMKDLENEYRSTKIISIIHREGQLPKVEWSDLTESDVIATLFKALLFLTIDDFVYDALDGILDDDEDNDEDEER